MNRDCGDQATTGPAAVLLGRGRIFEATPIGRRKGSQFHRILLASRLSAQGSETLRRGRRFFPGGVFLVREGSAGPLTRIWVRIVPSLTPRGAGVERVRTPSTESRVLTLGSRRNRRPCQVGSRPTPSWIDVYPQLDRPAPQWDRRAPQVGSTVPASWIDLSPSPNAPRTSWIDLGTSWIDLGTSWIDPGSSWIDLAPGRNPYRGRDFATERDKLRCAERMKKAMPADIALLSRARLCAALLLPGAGAFRRALFLVFGVVVLIFALP